MHLIRAREIRLLWDGDKVCAMADDADESFADYGEDGPVALADLLARIRSEKTTLWCRGSEEWRDFSLRIFANPRH